MTDTHRKALNQIKAAGKDAQDTGSWDDYIRYDRLLHHIAEGHEPSKQEEELMQRCECVINSSTHGSRL